MSKTLFKNLKTKDYLTLLLITGLIFGVVYFEFRVPAYMQQLTPLIMLKAPVKEILITGGKMLMFAILSTLCVVASSFFSSRLSAGFSMRLRANIFSCVESFSLEEIKRFSTASLITRSTNDVMQLQMFLSMGITVILRAPITVVFALTQMIGSSWKYFALVGIAVAILVIAISIGITLALPRFRKMQTLTDNINRITRENLEGSRVVRAYNAEKFEENKFEQANEKLTKTSLFTGRVMSIIGPVMSFIMSGMSIGIFVVGSTVISALPNFEARLNEFSQITVFSRYAMNIIMSFMLLTMVFIMLPRAIVSAKRINEVLETKTSIKSGAFNGKTEKQGEVVFSGVSFKYPDAEEYVLKNVSFSANKGESIAFIGSTGSGKSTLINLIPRFYDATEGEIFVDGVNIKDYDISALRNKIGYISQRAVMFSGSVRSNLVFGQNGKAEPTDNELDEALKISCSNFVFNMDGQKDAFIAQGGANVSGGQKQRLSIARGIARNPEILIFDDTFSALDFKTDKKLRGNLKKHLKNATKLIVAQRIGTIKDCNKIVVLNDGEVVGIGTHAELLKNCKIYKEIALSQLSEEELK